MNDDVKDALAEVRLCVKNESDPTTWALNHVLAHIDSEQARQDAAVAAAREEQREAIYDRLNTLGSAGTRSPADLGIILRIVDESPLTATPLADRIAELEAFGRKVSAIRDSIVGSQQFNWSEHAYPLVAALGAAGFEGEGHKIASENFGTLLDRLEKAEAERDALRAQVSELEEYKQEGDDVEVAAQRLRFWAENPYACPVHFGARTACGQCYDSERALRRSTEAQVEAVLAECENTKCGADCDSATCSDSECHVARRMWRAMDGAKPK